MLSIGSVVDNKYKILSEIGHGGMSVVYLAINERANKTWAVKEVRKDGGNDSEVVQQGLIAETEMLKKLHHPHLPSIIDVIDKDDSFLIVMDYIEGKSLADLLRDGPQDPKKVVEWAKQLCDVLSYLHSRQPPIIYRDMKPANVMLKPDGNVTLIDFGTAREYKVHSQGDTTWLGTRGYAAPEQFGGHGQTDARTDIYCLGATMYHLLTGFSPADTNFAILPLRQLNPVFEGTGIEKVVAKCCEPASEDRYQSCAELLYDLENIDYYDDLAIRKRNVQWAAFVTSLVITVLSVIGAFGFRAASANATTRSYDSYIAQAKNVDTSAGIDAAMDFYRRAVGLRPSSPDAYLELLNTIEADMVFSRDESTLVQQCIQDTDGGVQKNIDYLEASNRQAYAEFVYRLANDYYFFYEGSDNRSKAAYWYSLVQNSEYLSEQNRELAQSLYTIGNYYSMLGSDKTVYAVGENSNNYLTFWNQMTALVEGDVVAKTGGTRYAAALYKEMVNQIYVNTANFKSFGVGKSDMEAQLDQIAAALKTLAPESTVIADQIEETTGLLESAREMVETTYTGVGG